MIRLFILIGIFLIFQSENTIAQSDNTDTMKSNEYYSELPDTPENYTSVNVAARMIDGLGFRYYWATEGLRNEDLDYRPTPEARSTEETLKHIYDLSVAILNTANKTPIDLNAEKPELTYDEVRSKTLDNLKLASELLKTGDSESLDEYPVQFKKDGEITEKPFWFIINGMLSDALTHTGQIVSFRRTSGNPVPKKISYFSGKVRD